MPDEESGTIYNESASTSAGSTRIFGVIGLLILFAFSSASSYHLASRTIWSPLIGPITSHTHSSPTDAWRFTRSYYEPTELGHEVVFTQLPHFACDRCVQPWKGGGTNFSSYPLSSIHHAVSPLFTDDWVWQWTDPTTNPTPWLLRVRAIGPNPIWVDGDGRFGHGASTWVPPGPCASENGPDQDWWFYRAYDHVTRPSIKRGVILTQHWSSHAFHFLLEALPRLALLPPEILLDTSTIFLLQSLKYPKQQIEILQWLGISTRLQFLSGDHATTLVTDELIVPQPCRCTLCNPRVLHAFQAMLFTRTWLREMTAWNVSHTNDVPQHVLWMQRKGSRRVTNNEELLKAAQLEWPGAVFHLLPANANLSEIVRNFHICDTIIGPHGAAWANMIFARPGYRAIEFIPALYQHHMYASQSVVFGARHHHFVHVPGADKDSDMLVPVGEFTLAMRLIRSN